MKKKKRKKHKHRQHLPNPIAVSVLSGMLDAASKSAEDAGLKTEIPALRSVFGMLIAGAIESSGGTTIDVEGVGPVKIRPADAQAVSMRSFAEYAQLLTAKTLYDQAKR